MYYTHDGTKPTTSSALYNGPITVATTQMLKAIAVATGYGNSSVASAAYIIAVPTPDLLAQGRHLHLRAVRSCNRFDVPAAHHPGLHSPTVSNNPQSFFHSFVTPDQSSSHRTNDQGNRHGSVHNSAVPTAASRFPHPHRHLPKAGTYNSAETVVRITDVTSPPAIYYSTFLIVQSSHHLPSLYMLAPVVASSSETIEAIAVASGYGNSVVTTATYAPSAP